MLVSQYISGISPEFTLTRSGDQVTATFHYDLEGYYDEELGYYLWDGEIGGTIGEYSGYFQQLNDRPMDLWFFATLTAGVTASGSYFVNDNIGGAYIEQFFTVTIYDEAANFFGTTGAMDLVFGSAFDDTFHSSGNGDIFEGGAGNDLYRVYSADTQVIETTGGGTDRVATGVSYTLAAGVEVEMLTTLMTGGTTAINLTGNKLAQTIIGNAGNNVLHGGGAGAADTLRGLGGDDTYRIYNAGDTIIETAAQGAYDLVMAAVDYVLTAGARIERLATNGTAGTAGIDLTGNEFGQEVVGNSGINILDGKGGNDTMKGLAGNDILTGGAGADKFAFSTPLNAATNVDRITDYSVADDTIQVDNAAFAALIVTGPLAAGAFRANATGLAADADDRIIYETDTGELYYDFNGNAAGGGIHFATITAGLGLTNADFVVI